MKETFLRMEWDNSLNSGKQTGRLTNINNLLHH